MTIPKITPYSGGVANPDGSQTQTEFTQNMFGQLSYEAQLASELNETVNATNTTASEVDDNAAIAQNASDAAQASANFDGDFIPSATSAVKGKSYSYSGNVWLCLQDTTSTPSTANAAWKLSVGEQYVAEITDPIIANVANHESRISSNETDIADLFDGQGSGVIVFQTYALLDAYTPANSTEERGSFKVTQDPDSSLNGYYSWVSGTTYTKDADLVVNTIDRNNTSDAVSGSAVFSEVSHREPLFARRVIDSNLLYFEDTVLYNSQLPANGSFTRNTSRDVSDFIDVSGLDSITVSTTDGKLVCGGIAFYITKSDSAALTVGSYGNNVAEFTAQIPKGYKYAVLVLRRDVSSLPYYGDTCVVTSPDVALMREKDVDAKITEISPELFEGTLINLNKQPPLNGNFPDDPTRDVSDFIEVTGLTSLTLTTTDEKLVCGVFVFYSTKDDALPIVVGSYSNNVEEFTAEVPEGASYVVLMLRRDASSLPFYGDTCELHATGYTTITPQQVDKKIDSATSGADYTDFSGKKLSIFTSSNGHPNYGTWAVDLAADLGMTLNNSGAYPGASYPLFSEGGNSIVTSIEEYNTNYPDPVDIIMFNSGSNDSAISNLQIGDFETVITKTLAEIRASNDPTFGINTLYGAMRYCFETMRTAQPDAFVFVMTPFQYYEPNNSIFFNTIYEPLKKMARWCGCTVIDCFADGTFSTAFETQGQVGRYTLDGIHVKLGNSINDAGRLVQRNFLGKQLKSKFYTIS